MINTGPNGNQILVSQKLISRKQNKMKNKLSSQPEQRFGLLLFNDSFSINRLYRAIEAQCISRKARKQHNHTIEQ